MILAHIIHFKTQFKYHDNYLELGLRVKYICNATAFLMVRYAEGPMYSNSKPLPTTLPTSKHPFHHDHHRD